MILFAEHFFFSWAGKGWLRGTIPRSWFSTTGLGHWDNLLIRAESCSLELCWLFGKWFTSVLEIRNNCAANWRQAQYSNSVPSNLVVKCIVLHTMLRINRKCLPFFAASYTLYRSSMDFSINPLETAAGQQGCHYGTISFVENLKKIDCLYLLREIAKWALANEILPVYASSWRRWRVEMHTVNAGLCECRALFYEEAMLLSTLI